MPKKIYIPFLSGPITKDLIFVWALIPAWYFLGIDQLVWPLLGYLFLIKLLALRVKYKGGPLLKTTYLKLFLAFLIVHAVSGAFIGSTGQKPYLFIRDMGLYLSAFMFSVIIINHFTDEDVRNLLKAFIWVAAFTVMLSLLCVTGIVDYDFYSIFTPLFPDAIKNNSYFANMIHKTPFELESFEEVFDFKLFQIKRPRGIFMDSNPFGGFMAATIPLCLYIVKLSLKKHWKPVVYGLAFIFSVFLLLTLSRSAILGLMLGVAVFFVTARIGLKRKVSFAVLVTVVLLINFFAFDVHEIFLERFGSGSDITRYLIYSTTINEILNYPIFGHGTVMAFPGRPNMPPLGSHSTVMRLLFSQGVVGLAVFASMVATVALALVKLARAQGSRDFYNYMVIAFIAIIFQSLFYEWLFDAAYFMAVWILFAVIIRARSKGAPDEAT